MKSVTYDYMVILMVVLIEENAKGTTSKCSLACEIILLFYLFLSFLCCYFFIVDLFFTRISSEISRNSPQKSHGNLNEILTHSTKKLNCDC